MISKSIRKVVESHSGNLFENHPENLPANHPENFPENLSANLHEVLPRESGHPQGFISIIALAIFAVMMIVAMNLRMTTVDTYNNIISNLNQSQAETISDSMTEYLLWKMKNHEAGWNTGEVICGFGKHKGETTLEALGGDGGGTNGFCQDTGMLLMVAPDPGKEQKDIKIALEVIGHSTKKLNSSSCWKNAEGCYVTPIPGTGDAGDQKIYCKMYEPSYIGDSGEGASSKVSSYLANGSTSLDQANYSCNWNQLSLGSSQTDRVAIPLYYDDSGLSDVAEIRNPFIDEKISLFSSTATKTQATKLVVKLRTPCKPCAKKGVKVDNSNWDYLRDCEAELNKVKDETVCGDEERYELDADIAQGATDDIIVQWRIDGECDNGKGKTETCGIMPIANDKDSALYESKILGNNASLNEASTSYTVIEDITLAHDSNNFPAKVYLLKVADSETAATAKLQTISKPILTLFLNKPLYTENKHNIPYLEYQVLADQPIANNQAIIQADVGVNGNGYRRTLKKAVKKPLIDFAIHN